LFLSPFRAGLRRFGRAFRAPRGAFSASPPEPGMNGPGSLVATGFNGLFAEIVAGSGPAGGTGERGA